MTQFHKKRALLFFLLLVLTFCVTACGAASASSEEATPTPAPSPTATPEPTAEPIVIPVDFAALQQQNPDVYAWITVPGTTVDDAVLQSAENSDYYLNHTIDHVKGLPGALYTQNFSAQDFSDKMTVIYGHNMKNKTMFGSLHNYDDEAFFNENKELVIYTPEHILNYRVFAAVVYTNALITSAYDFDDPVSRQLFLDSLGNTRNLYNHIDEDYVPDADAPLLVLSTCVHSGDARYRWIIVAAQESVQ